MYYHNITDWTDWNEVHVVYLTTIWITSHYIVEYTTLLTGIKLCWVEFDISYWVEYVSGIQSTKSLVLNQPEFKQGCIADIFWYIKVKIVKDWN